MKRPSMKCKAKRNKMASNGEIVECIGTLSVLQMARGPSPLCSPKEHQKFRSSYATVLKAHMRTLKRRERKDEKKAADGEKDGNTKKVATSKPT